jgi:ABC-type branched-subunit amino acid transport system permease subunit
MTRQVSVNGGAGSLGRAAGYAAGAFVAAIGLRVSAGVAGPVLESIADLAPGTVAAPGLAALALCLMALPRG